MAWELSVREIVFGEGENVALDLLVKICNNVIINEQHLELAEESR